LTPDDRVREEIAKCARDFDYFCRYLRIVDKRGKTITFRPNVAQKALKDSLERSSSVYVLKARQLGITTKVAARLFWKALLVPNFKVCVIAHGTESAEVIFEIYKRFYGALPPFLRFETEKANVREMKFFHGGLIRVATANSDSFRGTTYQALHCSEFGFWNDVDRTIAAAFQTAGPDAEIILETTANGMNDAHKMWRDENGFRKLFLGWTLDSEYIVTKKPKALSDKVKAYSKEYELTNHQTWWAEQTYRTKCGANWNIFLQEYPLDAEHAFITSGERFFPILFPHSVAREGVMEYGKKKKYSVYSMGVDVASGSPSGDFSALSVMDVTNKKKPVVVETGYYRISPAEFGAEVLRVAKKWEPLVVVESNTYGLSVLEYLMAQGWAYIFRRTQYDKMAAKWLERVGFNTNVNTRPVMLARLHEYVSQGWLDIKDERMKTEVNTFVYNDKGRPEASSKKHDDMIMSYALCLMGIDQIEPIRQDVMAKEPESLADMLQFERTTGKVYRSHADSERQDRWGTPYEQASLIDSALNEPPTWR